jgi:hypothetical protein
MSSIVGRISEKFQLKASTRLIFFSARGVQNVHIYLWCMYDLLWSLNYVTAGMVFSCLALAWATFLFYHVRNNSEELYFLVPIWLQLIGNLIWLKSEFGGAGSDLQGRYIGGYIILAGAILAQIYFIARVSKFEIFRKLLKNNKDTIAIYEKNGFVSYFSLFENWRQYEFFHTMCWIISDVAWCFKIKWLWFISIFITSIISLDFIRVTMKTKKLAMDLTHYIVLLMWLISNFIWSAGELFEITSDDTHSLFIPDPITCRWLSAVVLALAFVPIIILYVIWIPFSYFGIINEEHDMILNQDQDINMI